MCSIKTNTGLADQPYILAFSLIMLHTDAFNKSNKNKMTKADYARNTRLDGVNRLVLDVRSAHRTHLSVPKLTATHLSRRSLTTSRSRPSSLSRTTSMSTVHARSPLIRARQAFQAPRPSASQRPQRRRFSPLLDRHRQTRLTSITSSLPVRSSRFVAPRSRPKYRAKRRSATMARAVSLTQASSMRALPRPT